MNLKELLYPPSRFEVLRTLYLAKAPTPLREIAYRSDLLIGSVQSQLRILEKRKLVRRRRWGGQVYYELTDIIVIKMLSKILPIFIELNLKAKGEALNKRALSILPSIEERNKIIKKAKRSICQ